MLNSQLLFQRLWELPESIFAQCSLDGGITEMYNMLYTDVALLIVNLNDAFIARIGGP